MKTRELPEREALIQSALSARTPEEIERALEQLNQWRVAHPDDEAIRDTYAPLTLRQTLLTASPQELALAK